MGGGAIAPKRRIGKTRKRIRRSHHALRMPGFGLCPNCGEMKINHHICSCGWYNGKAYISHEKKETKETETPKKTKSVKKEEATNKPASTVRQVKKEAAPAKAPAPVKKSSTKRKTVAKAGK